MLKKCLFYFLLITLPLVIVLSSVEIGLRLFYPVDEKAWAKKNPYEWAQNGYCPFSDSIKLDPSLAYVWDRSSLCNAQMRVNNVNLEGDDFPLVKNPNDYVVLLMGGSVAHRLGNKHPTELYNYLVKRHKGKNVRLLVGAHGGWSYPQQFHLFARFAPMIDAVISLDGFNETLQIIDIQNPFGSSSWPFMVKDRKQKSLKFMLSGKAYRTLEEYKEKNSCGFSYLCHFLVEKGQSLLLKKYIFDEEGLHVAFRHSTAYDHVEAQEAQRLNLLQYMSYLRMTDYIARGYKIDVYHFLQPVPALQKSLTVEEKSFANISREFTMDTYREKYLQIEKAFLALKKEKMKVYSLVPIFSQVKEPIYIDHIHMNELGNKIMTNVMIEKLEN